MMHNITRFNIFLSLLFILLSCDDKKSKDIVSNQQEGDSCLYSYSKLNEIYFNDLSDKKVLSVNELIMTLDNDSLKSVKLSYVKIPAEKSNVIIPFRIIKNRLGIPLPSLYKVQLYPANDSLSFRSTVIDTMINTSSLPEIIDTSNNTGDKLNENYYSLSILSPASENQLRVVLNDAGKRYKELLAKRFSKLQLDSCKKPTDSQIEELLKSNTLEIIIRKK